jgi:pyruvate/2-oxoglutarate dehydrogenase complex dihydrolipoamide acyltransferase (E2) component
MPTPLYTPRVNNNDDTVRLVKVLVAPGAAVRAGDIVAEVETDKANFTVEAEQDGYVLAIEQALNETIDVGSVLLWIGATPGEAVPSSHAGQPTAPAPAAATPTLKAAQLLVKHGLSASQVPASGDRLSVRDIELYLASRTGPPDGTSAAAAPAVAAPTSPDRPAGGPSAPGLVRALTPEERGMLRTVLWQRDHAVTGYVELQYDAAPWERLAAEYQKSERLLVSPLLSLMAFRLVRVAAERERLNATIVDDALHVYSTVNLGFTIQSDRTLYLAVVQNAAAMSGREFVSRLGDLQRGALGHKLRSADLTGATISFSSMSRWNVSRHVPVLPPFTSLIVAHAATVNGVGTLGATYDHRVLTGFDALAAVREVSVPEGLS